MGMRTGHGLGGGLCGRGDSGGGEARTDWGEMDKGRQERSVQD